VVSSLIPGSCIVNALVPENSFAEDIPEIVPLESPLTPDHRLSKVA
jgi:hypothetical protein